MVLILGARMVKARLGLSNLQERAGRSGYERNKREVCGLERG